MKPLSSIAGDRRDLPWQHQMDSHCHVTGLPPRVPAGMFLSGLLFGRYASRAATSVTDAGCNFLTGTNLCANGSQVGGSPRGFSVLQVEDDVSGFRQLALVQSALAGRIWVALHACLLCCCRCCCWRPSPHSSPCWPPVAAPSRPPGPPCSSLHSCPCMSHVISTACKSSSTYKPPFLRLHQVSIGADSRLLYMERSESPASICVEGLHWLMRCE